MKDRSNLKKAFKDIETDFALTDTNYMIQYKVVFERKIPSFKEMFRMTNKNDFIRGSLDKLIIDFYNDEDILEDVIEIIKKSCGLSLVNKWFKTNLYHECFEQNIDEAERLLKKIFKQCEKEYNVLKELVNEIERFEKTSDEKGLEYTEIIKDEYFDEYFKKKDDRDDFFELDAYYMKLFIAMDNTLKGFKYELRSYLNRSLIELKIFIRNFICFVPEYKSSVLYLSPKDKINTTSQKEPNYPQTEYTIPFNSDSIFFKDEYSTKLFCYLIDCYHKGKDKELSNIYQWMENNGFIQENKRKEFKDLVKNHKITTQKYNRVHAKTEYKANELDPTFNELKKQFDKEIKQ